MVRLILLLLVILVFFAGLTYLLGRLSPRVKSIKYLPALLCLLLGIYYLYLAKTVDTSGFADLANALMSMIFFTGFAAGLGMGLILDFLLPRYKS
jgi:hypothetical protein